MAIENLIKKEIPITGKKARNKRWLRRRPDYVIKRLKRWVEKEKEPTELRKAKAILKRYLDKFPEK